MKSIFITLLIAVSYLFSFERLTGFLQPGNYTLEYGDDLLKNENWDVLNLAVGLTSTDIDQAITQLYSQLPDVDGKPIINFSPIVNASAQCKITYAYLPNNAIMQCNVYENIGFTSFEIIVNTEIHYNSTWNNQFGWNTHINLRSVLKHELGHALLGLEDTYDTEYSEVLLYGHNDVADIVTTIDLIPKNDDINGFRAVYEVPSLQVTNSHTFDGDTLKVFYENETDLVYFQVTTPNMLEFNSVTPPDLIPKGYFIKMDNSNSGLVVNLQAQGNDIYTYQITVENLTGYIGSNTMKFRSFIERSGWDYVDYRLNYSPCSENILKFVPKPTNESPIQGEDYYIKSSGGKEEISDTLAVKVRVPEVLGSYPAINIKIDDVYVNQGDITFDSEENVWVYYWDLSTVSPTEFGKRYTITSEIDGDPISNDVTGIYLVEALLYEDFETITDLTAAGWAVSFYEFPLQAYTGWWIGNDELDPVNQCSKSIAYVNSTSMAYRLYSPAFTLPTDPDAVTKLEYKLYLNISSLPMSLIKFYICNASNTIISPALELNQYAIDGSWVNLEYDLSEFAGQTIKLHWNHYYNSATPCKITTYQLDDILVYTIPDMDGPSIDFIAGNTADLNEDMNLTLGFNDYSGISEVSADYTIDGESGSLWFYPVKGTYNYAGTLPAKDHECSGLITYKLTDSVGNETVSSGHYIGWALGGGILSAPENVVISALNDSTVSVTWDIVDGATGYKVYSSVDPYGTFSEDSTGTFTESRKWEKAIDGNKYFYYVIATNPTKFDVEAIKEEDFEIAKAIEENVSDR